MERINPNLGGNGDSTQNQDAPTDPVETTDVEERVPVYAVLVGIMDDGKIYFTGNPPIQKQRDASLDEMVILLSRAHRYIEFKSLVSEVLGIVKDATFNVAGVAVQTALNFMQQQAENQRIIRPS